MAELQERYSGIVLAYGADQDKTFGLPGTSMALVAEGGCVMTRALKYMHVAWKPFFASQYGSAQEPVGHIMFVLWTPSFQVKSVAEYYRRETLLGGTTGYRTAGISSLTCLGIPPSCSGRWVGLAIRWLYCVHSVWGKNLHDGCWLRLANSCLDAGKCCAGLCTHSAFSDRCPGKDRYHTACVGCSIAKQNQKGAQGQVCIAAAFF